MDVRPRDEPPVVLETGTPANASIIWLHGLGADGHDFVPLVPQLRLPPAAAWRFVFPHAPYRPVTLNGGYIMRAWYDIAMTEHGLDQHAGHIRESQEILLRLIAQETRRGIPSERIVLAGFSQGGAIALHAGLRHPQPLAGILALSAPLPFAEALMHEIHPANEAVPIFLAHGTDDQLIPFALAEQTREVLRRRGLMLAWHTYRMGHTVVPQEIGDIARWLARVLDRR
jgi:phospholipase/carboxylesterase